jgi:protein-tyrosine phosphatase
VIDLHCHILPGLDDGADNLSVSLKMAKASVEQGVEVVACTPHILPGLYPNSGPGIRQATAEFQAVLEAEGIALRLVPGADVHVCADFVEGLRSGRLLSIADSRYVLVEPPHHTPPPHLEDFFFKLIAAGYVPVLTHPERLSWVPSRYDAVKRMARSGVWMQLTAGSFAGAFGRNALYWAQRMLDEGYVHLIATDAHNDERRPPDLARGRECVAKRVGAEEAQRLVLTRPMGMLKDVAPSSLPEPAGVMDAETADRPGDARSDSQRHANTGSRADSGLRRLSGRLHRFFR